VDCSYSNNIEVKELNEVAVLLNCRDYVYSGSSDNTIKVWKVKSMELQHTIKGHNDPVCTLACSDAYLFSGSLRTIKVCMM